MKQSGCQLRLMLCKVLLYNVLRLRGGGGLFCVPAIASVFTDPAVGWLRVQSNLLL